ncbi:hypothetical protein ACTXLV_13950 [Brachybacterium alimentarium]|uniref:hypothetical protein n=1 Tax=Brachybacterium alimentarium TaxID=47845 RepID=UPI003FD68A3F
MRTNTWLGLIALNQMTQVLQTGNIARDQKARDEARDAMFATAHEAAKQGQFAMWIQTPDGQRFERWSRHALEASRAIDDRQVAWDLAWEQEFLEQQETAKPTVIADAEASVPQVSAELMRSSRRQGIVASVATFIFGAVWVTLISIAPYTPEGEIIRTPESIVAFVLMLVAGGVSAWRLWVSFADNRHRALVDAKVEGAMGKMRAPLGFSWHRRASLERLREVQTMISEMVENAPSKYPRNDDLVQLTGTYDTRPPHADEMGSPESVQRLLEAFREQDRERRSILERDGIA